MGILLIGLLGSVWAQAQTDALAEYRDANYKVAIPLLKTAIAADPQNALLHAALLSALTYEGGMQEAADEAEQDAKDFPQSAEVTAARGEFAYYMADMGEAEKLYKAAMQMNAQCARAWFGLARLFQAEAMRRSSRTYCLKAHELDPKDARITAVWLGFLSEDERAPLLKPFFHSHPWLFPTFDQYEETKRQVEAAVHGRKPFAFDGVPTEVQLHLEEIRSVRGRLEGFGLELKINGARKFTLLLDTGASGILLSPQVIRKAGLDHLGSFDAGGVGDQGTHSAFEAVAETCEIGPIRFKTCLVRGVEQKNVLDQDYDGLIGPDVFSNYLIGINFRKLRMDLKPLPRRPEAQEGYDREVPQDEKDFTPVYQFADHLLVSTKVNKRATGLFLLDTGAQVSNIDYGFAQISGKLWSQSARTIMGLSGEVKKVMEVDNADIEFAGFSQSNVGMLAFDMNNLARHQEVRYSGVLGLPALTLFRLTLDYRNGLVKFDYRYK